MWDRCLQMSPSCVWWPSPARHWSAPHSANTNQMTRSSSRGGKLLSLIRDAAVSPPAGSVSSQRVRLCCSCISRETTVLCRMESSLEFSNSLGSVSSVSRCRTFKVLVIGDSGVGKTCLTHRLCAGQFPSRVEATIGVDFRERLLDVDGEKLKVTGELFASLNIWVNVNETTDRTPKELFYFEKLEDYVQTKQPLVDLRYFFRTSSVFVMSSVK